MSEKEFDNIWRKYHNDLFYFILSLVGNGPINAEDILHDAYLKAFMAATQLRNVKKTKKWLFQIAKNVVLDELKRNEKRITIDLSLLDELISHDEIGIMNLDKVMIDEYLKTLPEDFRRMLYFHIYYGFTATELAQMYQISYIALRKHLYRAKKKIVKMLTTYEATGKGGRINAQ